ncbi:polysaccharide deacetylase family protein [Polaromonas sp.]|uniref:polysaccharide deacetylase family protein n=1 Tax=Polaromonas sp. TaxID=1869339 RepID=UPI002869F6FD|nr:polysaccharide deacetylase family protein [Polaromonas sp.]
MADNERVVSAGLINQASLAQAYTFILRTLHNNGLKATAAFVSCFAADAEAVRESIPLIEQLAALNPGWFARLLPALRRGAMDGWVGADFYRSLSVAGHEMAWHGATHLPLSAHTSPEAVALELQLASRLFRELGQVPRTLVFPRNQVGHLPQLREFGFETYRASLPGGMANRLSGLLNEWNLFDHGVMDKPGRRGAWQVSPAGYFLNWPSGVRAAVPVAVTVRRWKSLLRHAAGRGGYVHMWFHPHNLITAPAMQIAFDEIMGFAGGLVKSGDMLSLTMAEANKQYQSGELP